MIVWVWIRIAIVSVVAAACSTPSPSTPTNRVEATAVVTTKTVSVPPFGDITVEAGELKLMDRNNGDKRVHVMSITRDFHGSKLSWADQPGPRSDVNSGTFPIDGDEREQIRSWSQQIWELAPDGRRTFPKPPDAEPAYEWAIVIRRGDEVRVIEGGAGGPDDGIEAAVDFLDMHF